MQVVQEHASPQSISTGALPDARRVFLMLNSFETGGSERQFAILAKSLNAEKFSVSLGCIQTKGPLRDLFGEVPRFKLGGSVYGWKSWHSRWRLAEHLRKRKIEVAHAFDFYTNLTLLPAAKWARVPVLIGSQRQLGDLLTPAQQKLQRAAFSLCDAVVCNSRAAAERLAADGLSRDKIRIIGNAIPADAFAQALPILPRRVGALRIGMVARMNTYAKNHRAFLHAAAKLRTGYPNLEFVLAGDGPLRKEFESEAESLGIAENVKFLGDQRDVAAVFACLDVTIVPSDSESLSNVILESMAAGVPVVARAVGGNPELIASRRGILINSVESGELAGAIAELLQNASYRRELANNAQQFVREHFSVQSITQQYEDLYNELLSTKVASRGWKEFGKRSRDKLRVAIVGPSLHYVGGQSVQVDLLLKQWRDDPEVHATFIPVDPPFPRGLRWVTRVPFLRTLVRTPFYMAGLWNGLRDADVSHVFSASYSSFLVAPVPACLVAKLRRKKVLIHYHSGEARDHLQGSRIARGVLRHVDGLITPSAYLVDVFREFNVRSEPVPNIVDLSQFSFRERRPLRPHLVCTRGFHPYYCVDLVVKAFAEVQKEFPHARLDLVGGGALEAEIRGLVSDLQLAGVSFCGVASREEIATYYDRADLFINASRLDNMPVSILEAFASGTPVISTAPEGMRYLVEHGKTGLLSEPGDVQALAGNIIRVLRDPQLAAALTTAAREQLKQYRWEIVRGQWMEIYRSLVFPSTRTRAVAG